MYKFALSTKQISKIHICDDGIRQKLKELCDKYDTNYITRNDNAGAKAGNINNALKFVKEIYLLY